MIVVNFCGFVGVWSRGMFVIDIEFSWVGGKIDYRKEVVLFFENWFNYEVYFEKNERG